MINITEKSTKAEIIDLSCEIIDTQAEQLEELKQQKFILAVVASVLLVINFIWLHRASHQGGIFYALVPLE